MLMTSFIKKSVPVLRQNVYGEVKGGGDVTENIVKSKIIAMVFIIFAET